MYYDKISGTWAIDMLAPLNTSKTVTKVPVQKGNNPMAYDSYSTKSAVAAASVTAAPLPEVAQRDYLKKRAYEIQSDIRSGLRETYKLDGYFDNAPKTYDDMVARLKAGEYTIDEAQAKKHEIRGGFYPFEYFSWRTDADKEDRAGFDAATTDFSKVYQATLDTIVVSDPKDGLTALQALEAWTPTGAAN